MSSFCRRSLIGFSGALILLLSNPVDAQIVRRFAGGGVAVRAPLVRVNVGPYGATSVRAPFVAVDPGGVRVGIGQRRAPVPYYGAAPAVQQPAAGPQMRTPTPAAGQAAVPATNYVPYPTAEQLAAMDDQTLFAALSDLNYGLDARLARLNTGDGWRRYLNLSETSLVDPAAHLEEFERMLVRFDSVADNPEFAKIAGLPSFIATKAALRQVVTRLAEPNNSKPQVKSPAKPTEGPAFPAEDAELLPTPAEPKVPEATQGERSILKKSSSN